MAASLDIVPAQVRIAGKLWNKTRVVISDGKIHILAMVRGKPQLLASAAVQDCLPCNGGVLNVVKTADESYDIRRAGCTCGTKALQAVDWRTLVEQEA